jgi:hypothetical protein
VEKNGLDEAARKNHLKRRPCAGKEKIMPIDRTGQLTKAIASGPDLRIYGPVMEIEGVKIKIPYWSKDMQKNLASWRNLGDRTLFVDRHYSILAGICGGMVQRNLFGFVSHELGCKCVATIRLFETTTDSGKPIMMVDIFKAEKGATAYYEFRFGTKHDWDIELQGSKEAGIAFDPLAMPYYQRW